MAKPLLSQLRWDVTIQTPSVTGNSVVWANTAAWAGIETSFAGPESQHAGQVAGQVTYLLLFRAEAPVTANSRVVWNGVTLRVQSVRMVNPAYLEVLATEKQ